MSIMNDKEKTLIIEKSCIYKLNYIVSTKKLSEKISKFLY